MEELWEHVLIVIPKPAFCDWLNTVLKDQRRMTMEELYEEPLIIKLGRLGKRCNRTTILEKDYLQIMEHEFGSWTGDDSLWPSDRTLEAFHRYFTTKLDSPYRLDNL